MQPALSVVPDSEPKLADLLAAHPKNGSNIKTCRIVWGKLSPEQKRKAWIEHPKHVAYWKATDKDPEFVKRLETWLARECFEDELPEINSIGRNGHNGSGLRTEADIVEEFRRRGKQVPMGKSIDECRRILL